MDPPIKKRTCPSLKSLTFETFLPLPKGDGRGTFPSDGGFRGSLTSLKEFFLILNMPVKGRASPDIRKINST